MQAKIETATIDLIERLFEIEKKSFKEEAFSRQQIANLLTDYNSISLVARADGAIVGFVIGILEMDRNSLVGHVLTIDVAPPFRRKDIATQLLREIETWFKAKGASECLLEVREDNIAALKLYEKEGYRKIGCLERYYGEKHGLHLRKIL